MINGRVIVALALFLMVFGFLNVIFVHYLGMPFSPIVITGHAVEDTGIVSVFIDTGLNIMIDSPENITYNFDKFEPLLIWLNVSANFEVNEPGGGWQYSIFDLSNNVSFVGWTDFTPNTTITVTRRENRLSVRAFYDGGGWVDESVIFYVNVSNSAPLLGYIDNPILVCESERLNYSFNATDVDGDDLVGDISPSNPFFLSSDFYRVGNTSFFRLVSAVLGKTHVAGSPYFENISVLDPADEIDSFDTSIEVIEVNNAPVILNPLGVQTIWLKGENSTFYYKMNVTDVEDGGTDDGNLTFFSLNSHGISINQSGVVTFSSSLFGSNNIYPMYTLMFLHITDKGIVEPENFSVCSAKGFSSGSLSDSFSLAFNVVDSNRAPQILNYTPIDDYLNVGGTTSLNFYAEVYDPDMVGIGVNGTNYYPDIEWYVDGVMKERIMNMSNDSFDYVFGCGVSGFHEVMINASDGLLNDSQTWFVNVAEVECPVSSGGGGGGGMGGGYCMEEWVCDDWEVCQNVKRSYDVEVLSLEDYYSAKDICAQEGYDDERFCGFQLRNCFDLNDCGREIPKVATLDGSRICYFTENPNCYDGITNCHSGGCELLVDCGGPCGACATCSDGEQNQGEAGADCGGPCPFDCKPDNPFVILGRVLAGLSILLVLFILYVGWKVVKLIRNKGRS